MKIGPVVVTWPFGSAIVTSVFPGDSSGTIATCVSFVVESTIEVAPPKLTRSRVRNRRPVIVTGCPGEPASGSTLAMIAAGSSAVV